MVNRARLWSGVKASAGLVGLLLLLTPGLPLIAGIARTGDRWGVLGPLEAMGWRLLPLVPLLLLLLAGGQFVAIVRRQREINRRMADAGVTYLLLPRPDAPVTRAGQVTLWQRLSQLLPGSGPLSFELSGDEAGIVFSLRAGDDGAARAVLTQVMTESPGTEARRVSEREADPLWTPPDSSGAWIALAPADREQPLVRVTPDPLGAVLGELALLPRGSRAGVQVLVREDPRTRNHLMSKAARLTGRKPETGPYALRASNEDRREVRLLDERAQQRFVEARIVLWACAGEERRARQIVRLLAGVLKGQYGAPNPLRIAKQGRGSRAARDFPAFSGSPWTPEELGTLAHLVGGDAGVLAPQLLRARGRPLPAPPATVIPAHARIAGFLRQTDRDSMDTTTPGSILVVEEAVTRAGGVGAEDSAVSATAMPAGMEEDV